MNKKTIFKKITALFLLLVTVIFTLVSCKSSEEPEMITALDISGYKIVKPDVTSKDITETVSNFKKLLLTFTGAELKVESDWYNPSQKLDESACEILVGNTNRTLSADVAKELEETEDENSFIIKVTDNKIAILGKNDDMTKKALKYFLVNYAKVVDNTSKTVNLTKEHCEIKTADPDSVLFSNFTEFNIELRTTVTAPSTKFAVGTYEYPTMIKLQYNGEHNGTLLSTLESGDTGYRILKSTDDGANWEQIASVRDNLNKNYVTTWMPFLYELPVDIGNYKAGTIILAATSRNRSGEDFEISTITLYVSTDIGKSWKTICNVDKAGGLSWGVWEPFLIYDEGTKRLYCFYSDDSDPNHDQKLVYKYTTDLKTWSELKECVACADPALRPGMISIAKMNNGEYAMAFEMVGISGSPIYLKKTKDLDDWGDVADYGTPVKSTDGITFGSAPWCSWTPAGGECGTLIVVGKHPVPYEETDKGAAMLISFDYGKTYVAIDNPIPYDIYSDSRCGYSPHLSFSEDGSVLYYMNNPEYGVKYSCEYIELVKIKITSIYD
ncbi:MAG: exo-alpha-sialidase [Ruminococcaceae bacterium]|nr:exo-alpha-sialidase [Oscillospiraceae bacterium]